MYKAKVSTHIVTKPLFKWKVHESSPQKGMDKVFRLCVLTVQGTHVPRLSKQLSDGTKVLQAAEKHRERDRGTRAPLPYITTKKPLHCSKTYLWLSLDKAACGVAGQKEPLLSSELIEVAIQPIQYCTNFQPWKDDKLQNLLKHVLQMLHSMKQLRTVRCMDGHKKIDYRLNVNNFMDLTKFTSRIIEHFKHGQIL